MARRSPLQTDLVRFGAVTVLGVVIDLATGFTLATRFGVPLPIAAVFGFAAAASVNYVLHELWTFRHGARRLSLRRGGLYLITLCLTLGTRIAAVLVIQRAFPGAADHKLATLLAATGLSFLVNFGLSRYLVFAGRPHEPGVPASDEVRMSDTGGHFPDTWQVPEFSTLLLAARRCDYALVIPVINEGERIRSQLLRIQAAKLPVDVIVADGGSTDGSLDAEFVGAAGVRAVLTKTGPGRLSAQLRMAYAWCLMQGYSGIVTIDGNGKDNVEAVSSFVARLASGKDYVQGSRYEAGGKAENTPLERAIGNRLIHAPLMSLAGGRRLTDTTNGYRAYSRRYLLDARVAPFREVFVNYELLFYLTVRAGQLGFEVEEIPVERRYPRGERTPTKITGLKSKLAVLAQTVKAATGAYHP